MHSSYGADMSFHPRQIAAFQALLAGSSQIEAGRRAGVCERTVARWQSQPEFRRALSETRRQAMEQALLQACLALPAAVTTVRNIVNDHTAPAHARISACKLLFDIAFREQARERQPPRDRQQTQPMQQDAVAKNQTKADTAAAREPRSPANSISQNQTKTPPFAVDDEMLILVV